MTTATTEDGRAIYKLRGGTKLADFVTSNRFVDIIQGPLGSGKTVGLCLRVMRHAQEQSPSVVDGLRKTRWAVVRNSFPDLKRTTIRTWLDLFPEHIYGRFNWGQALFHRIRFGDVSMEVDFLALDKPEDIRKLRSGEYTGIPFNELSFTEKPLFDEATSRVGRFPSQREGGATWSGVFADSNAPDEDHWLGVMTGQVDLPPNLTEEERQQFEWPPEWGFHLQPPALIEKLDQYGRVSGYDVNPDAENIENLPKGYYAKQIAGKSKAWIDSRLMVRIVLVVDGSPVWPMFRREVHVSHEALRPIAHNEVVVGLDFGRQPAAVFMQRVNNRILIQHELRGSNEGAVTFAPKVKRLLVEKYPNFKFRAYGDPKGADRTQTDERTGFDVFRACGIPVVGPPGLKQNNITMRVDTVAYSLNQMYDGAPVVSISPLCRSLIVGMAGRYFNERDETGELKPCKKDYSHICDALQYAMIGLGEGRSMIGLDSSIATRPLRVYHGRRSLRRVSA